MPNIEHHNPKALVLSYKHQPIMSCVLQPLSRLVSLLQQIKPVKGGNYKCLNLTKSNHYDHNDDQLVSLEYEHTVTYEPLK